ncbi:hypothetical protein Leryth_006497 [Lithospermum erythrorhizon]|nr:hypothetical protein Leryth_006497 [Lithospermum erythrorhizon]
MGRRKTKGRKKNDYKDVDYQVQLIQQPINNIGLCHNISPQARKRRACKEVDYKEVDYVDEDEVQLILEPTNVAGNGDNTAAEELHPLPSSLKYPTRSNNPKVTVADMQPSTLGDLAEEVTSLPLAKDCKLNGEASRNLTDLVQKLNKNVSDAEEVDSATHLDSVMVAGYKVKGEVAPVLREILTEHGDIASECILQTPETRAALLESVCMIYRELEPKFPNITSLVVTNMQARIKDLETVRLRVEWLYKRLEEVSNMKNLLDKSGSLEEARARCTESIEREERDLEALETELSNLQQKISSKKAALVLLKTEAETIKAAFETMSRMESLPEQSMVSMTRRTGGKKWSGPMPSSKVFNGNDSQLHSQTTLQHNSYKFIMGSYQQLRENDHPQPELPDHDSVACLKAQSCNPQSHSQSYNVQFNSRQLHSLPQSVSQNLQPHQSQSNLRAHSNRLSKPQHSTQCNSENECDQNYDASSGDVNDQNTTGGDYTPRNDRGTQNQDSSLADYSSRRQGMRGITKPLRGWGTGQKMMLQLNEHNQIIGKLDSAFASQLGVLAKDGKKLPLIYTDWRAIPGIYKDKIWTEIKDNTNLHDGCEKATLQRLSKLWRCWKGTIKEAYFTPYRNDDEKLAQHPPEERIEKDQWPILVCYWKSKADSELKENMIHVSDQNMVTLTGHQIGDEEPELERPGQVLTYSPGITPFRVPTGTKMMVTEYQKKALDFALRAEVEEVVGNMRETMTVELVEEMFSGVKQKAKAGLRGHMAFAVPSNRTQVPESSGMQSTTPYFEDQQRELPNCDSPSTEEHTKRRKRIH